MAGTHDESRDSGHMTARIAKSRQEPLGPDETFSALITRLITTNRVERAIREKASKAGPTLHRSDQREADPSDSLRA
jgi:hypothetical protein